MLQFGQRCQRTFLRGVTLKTSHSPYSSTPSWPGWSTAWRSPWCCASKQSPGPRRAAAGHSRWRGRRRSTLSCPPEGTTGGAPPPAQCPWTRTRTAWHPGLPVQGTFIAAFGTHHTHHTDSLQSIGPPFLMKTTPLLYKWCTPAFRWKY